MQHRGFLTELHAWEPCVDRASHPCTLDPTPYRHGNVPHTDRCSEGVPLRPGRSPPLADRAREQAEEARRAAAEASAPPREWTRGDLIGRGAFGEVRISPAAASSRWILAIPTPLCVLSARLCENRRRSEDRLHGQPERSVRACADCRPLRRTCCKSESPPRTWACEQHIKTCTHADITSKAPRSRMEA